MGGGDDATSNGGGGPRTSPKSFATVGIGASAGGVRALQEFFESLPEDVDAAFVVVIHLDPSHQSELANILASRTRLPVFQVKDRVPLEPRHVYVISPNRQLAIADGCLAVGEFDQPRWKRAPIDIFFRSLASHPGDNFAVILSGAGSDGSVGIMAMKEAGGIILVQDPGEAEYDSMPRSAIATGLADFVLPVREIAARLPELIRVRASLPSSDAPDEADDEARRQILSHLRDVTGHDFSAYKLPTIRRRIARRMQVQRATTIADYYGVMRDNEVEAQALFRDLLISVTMFFRDPAAFARLAETVIPALFEDKSASGGVRVWVPGCATGEEAYSIAILLLEEAARRKVRADIQIVASDLDAAALAVGREGRYPLPIEADVPDESLRRFFTREGDHYRVTRELRGAVLFARHSLLKDPPFSRIGLISCRNVLIYLDREMQQQVCATFHFASRPAGYLFVGSSENADSPIGLFSVIDRAFRIYQRRDAVAAPKIATRIGSLSFALDPSPSRVLPFRSTNDAGIHLKALERLAPPSVIVDGSYRILHLSESAGRYLQSPGGAPTNDALQMVREELRFELRSALHQALALGEKSLGQPVAVRFNGTATWVYLQARPIRDDPTGPPLAIVFFSEGGTVVDADNVAAQEAAPTEKVRRLEQELVFIQSHLHASREEYEGANEELRAANEELQSINEEYRSTAEELETSKEELQSTNEELQTVNAELKSELDQVTRGHNDIQNLITATDIGVLFLDNELRIRRFTPGIAKLFNIVAGDEGRPITDFTHGLEYDHLAADAQAVLSEPAPSEREVSGRNGAHYLMRMRRYQTTEDEADGVVVTFVDTTERWKAEEAARVSERFRLLVEEAPEAIVIVDFDHRRMTGANKAAERLLGASRDEILARDPLSFLAAEQPDERPVAESFAANGERALAGEEVTIERRIRRPSGEERLCRATLVRFPSDARQLRASLVDITEEVRIRRELASAAAILKTEHEASPDGILVVAPTGRILSANRRLAEILGVPHELLAAGAYPALRAAVLQQVTDAEVVARRLQYLTNHPDEYGRDEQPFKDGRVIDCITAPLKTEDGETLGRIVFFRDITERRKAEEALQASENRFRTLFEEAPDAVLLFDFDQRRVLAANKAAERLFGASSEEILRQGPLSFYTPEQPDGRPMAETYWRNGERALAGEAVIYERWIRRPSGEVRLARGTLVRLPSTIRLTRASLVDITDQRAVEAQLSEVLQSTVALQEADRQRIARELHDSLNQYLAALNMKLAMFGRTVADSAPLTAGVAELKGLTAAVADEVSRLAWELRPIALDDIGLGQAIEHLTDEWARRSGLQFDLHVDLKGRRLLRAVETTLYRVLQEAISNIVKHAGASKVGVALEMTPDGVVMIIEDNGKGFELEAVSRGSSPRLGLLGMRERVALIRGSLDIETGPGAGTTLIIRAPMKDSAAP